jgi:hypothetical protein
MAELLAGVDGEGGMLLPLRSRSSVDVDHLVAAMLAYLNGPELHAAHCQGARRIFEERFTVDRIAATCAEAYLEACNVPVPVFPLGPESPRAAGDETPPLPCRRYA